MENLHSTEPTANPSNSTLAAEFEKFFQTSNPNPPPPPEPPTSVGDFLAREAKHAQLDQEADKAAEQDGHMELHAYVHAPSDGDEVPEGTEFVINVREVFDSSDQCFDEHVDRIVATTFSEVEQVVTKLHERLLSKGVDGFCLHGDHDNPRLAQLAAKLGLVSQKDQGEGAA